MNLYARWRHLRGLPALPAAPRRRPRRRLTALTAGVAVAAIIAASLAAVELSSSPGAAADTNAGLQAAGLAVAKAITADPSIVTEMAAAAHADQPWTTEPSAAAHSPSSGSSPLPTSAPSESSSVSPSPSPSRSRSPSPSASASDSPGPCDGGDDPCPSDSPTDTSGPSGGPTGPGSPSPTARPSSSASPTARPSSSASPSARPSSSPTESPTPCAAESGDDGDPSASPCPSESDSSSPSASPSPTDSPSCDDSESPSDPGSDNVLPGDGDSSDPSDSPCASPSDSPSCDDSESPSDPGGDNVLPGDGDSSDPSDDPCESPSDSPSCDESDSPGDPDEPCVNPSPPPGPGQCRTDDPPVKSKINREILYDRADDGDNGCWSLIASGDSVTSSHYMAASAIPVNVNCPGTPPSANGDGNDYVLSWAGAAGTDWSSTKGVFTGDSLFAGGDYYNFARVGFDTTQMLTVTGKDEDSCGNPWNRTLKVPRLAKHTPFQLIVMAAKYEINQKERKVAWVTTGGVNDTNWLSARVPGQPNDWFGGVLLPYSACEVLANAALRNWFMRHGSWFTVTPEGVRPYTFEQGTPDLNDRYMQALLRDGGTCQLQVDHFRPIRFTVPKFNIATSGPTIRNNIAAMVKDGLQAGINKIIWVGYYDMTWAQVDIRGLLLAMVRNETVVNYIMGNAGLPQTMYIFSNRATPVVQGFLTDLDDRICEGVAAGKKDAGDVKGTAVCTRWQQANFNSANDMQTTVIGGMPHPSLTGMAKLATMVMQVLHQ